MARLATRRIMLAIFVVRHKVNNYKLQQLLQYPSASNDVRFCRNYLLALLPAPIFLAIRG